MRFIRNEITRSMIGALGVGFVLIGMPVYSQGQRAHWAISAK